MLNIQAIPAFTDNYIWLLREDQQQRVVIVDPGDAAVVQRVLAAENLTLAAILITHHHADHTGGVAGLLADQSAKSNQSAKLLKSDQSTAGTPVYGPRPYAKSSGSLCDHPVQEGDCVTLRAPAPALQLQVWETPGHTLDHIAYWDEQRGLLFCGDTLFTGGCGRLFEGSAEQMHFALSRFAALPPSTQVYCAHEYTQENCRFAQKVEPDNIALQERIEQTQRLRAAGQPTVPSTIALECATNPFLRCEQALVKAAAEAHAGRALLTAVEVFAVLREWKSGL